MRYNQSVTKISRFLQGIDGSDKWVTLIGMANCQICHGICFHFELRSWWKFKWIDELSQPTCKHIYSYVVQLEKVWDQSNLIVDCLQG